MGSMAAARLAGIRAAKIETPATTAAAYARLNPSNGLTPKSTARKAGCSATVRATPTAMPAAINRPALATTGGRERWEFDVSEMGRAAVSSAARHGRQWRNQRNRSRRERAETRRQCHRCGSCDGLCAFRDAFRNVWPGWRRVRVAPHGRRPHRLLRFPRAGARGKRRERCFWMQAGTSHRTVSWDGEQPRFRAT
jgi:hypothetical protein